MNGARSVCQSFGIITLLAVVEGARKGTLAGNVPHRLLVSAEDTPFRCPPLSEPVSSLHLQTLDVKLLTEADV